MKFLSVLLVLVSSSAFAEFTCFKATDPDCVRTVSWSIATGEHYVSDFIINHQKIISGGNIGDAKVSISFPKDSNVVSLNLSNGEAPLVLGKISDAGDLGLQSFFFQVEPGVSFSSKRVGTKKQKVCDPSSFGGSTRWTNVSAVVETTVTASDRKITYTSEKFIGIESEHHSIFRCRGQNDD